jgi:itaconate CoA-transferase
MLPLTGITVVSLEQAIAAPLATRHLADLGARVIKVERPGIGDFARAYDSTVNGLSSHFVWVNRSKESLTLDLKRPEAASLLRSLLATADVFLHNLAPGAVDRLGFSAESLRAEFPGLIICAISGYGSSGPFKDKKAYDLLIQAEAGLLSITGTASTETKVGISVADIAAGMYASLGVLSALFARTRTGQGAVIEVSLLEALAEWMGYPMYYALYGPTAPTRTGAHHATIAPYGPFRAKDGTTLCLAVQNEREWKKFCDVVLAEPALADDPRFESNEARVQNRGQLECIITQCFDGLTGDEVTRRLDSASIANARINSMQELIGHVQFNARHRWRDVHSPVGDIRALLPPAVPDGAEPVMGPIPALGEHTGAILATLGIDESTIESWRAQGIV